MKDSCYRYKEANSMDNNQKVAVAGSSNIQSLTVAAAAVEETAGAGS